MIDQETKLIKFKKFISDYKLKNSAKWGQIAEKFQKVQTGKARIPSLTKSAKYRIPDILLHEELIEIKNVKKQHLTSQLKDFLTYAKINGLVFTLYIRPDTLLSKNLEELRSSRDIQIKKMSPFFTREGQAKMYKAMRPMIDKVIMKAFENEGI